MDDAALAGRIRNGDREALGELYDRHAPQAFAVAFGSSATSPRPRTSSTTPSSPSGSGWTDSIRTAGRLRAWLLTIVRNRAIDRLRGTRPTMPVDDADEQSLLRTGPNPTWEMAAARLSAIEIRGVLETLPTEQREAIELAYFGGRTYREIAVLTGVPEGTASGRLRLGLAKLRSGLSDAMEQDR